VTKDWLRRMIAAGHLPKRWFGKFYVLADEDLITIRDLRQSEGRLPEPAYTGDAIDVGYPVERAAALAGVGVEFVRYLAEMDKIHAQRFGRGWIVFPDAIEQIKAAPQTTARRQAIDYRTKTGQPKPIPALTDRYKMVLRMYLAGNSFADAARELGISRERPSKMFATIKQRVSLLRARGITDIAEVGRVLGIDDDTATRLIALVQDVD
jgi:hypothetical protein